MRSLYWLVRLPLKAGSHAYALERSNIASTSQALRLANRDSISINRTALVSSSFKKIVYTGLEQHEGE